MVYRYTIPRYCRSYRHRHDLRSFDPTHRCAACYILPRTCHLFHTPQIRVAFRPAPARDDAIGVRSLVLLLAELAVDASAVVKLLLFHTRMFEIPCRVKWIIFFCVRQK